MLCTLTAAETRRPVRRRTTNSLGVRSPARESAPCHSVLDDFSVSQSIVLEKS